ncbi:hypothetical protein X766_32850 [Mesorhizobium sp. LSJC255A00]|nr:hypothetical protein X766_32850 [Mesorhizobium sp. LSJC255A00]ESX84947.1 hypothetical protein X756_24540 [Mesorhizobium sp. LSHC412B00]
MPRASAVDVDAQSWEYRPTSSRRANLPLVARQTSREKASMRRPRAARGIDYSGVWREAFEDEIECKMDELDTHIAQSLRSRLVRGARASELLVDRAD